MELLNDLNAQQIEAVKNIDKPLLILAGAGSGKTRVITYKISYLIENGVMPYNILALTFTNKATKEMKERAVNLNFSAKDVWISTFHALCVKILRKEIIALGYKNSFNIIDAKDSLSLIKNCLKELNLDEKSFLPKNIAGYISFNKNKMIGPDEFFIKTRDDFRLNKIAEVYKTYQEKLKAGNLLDFDDLLFFVAKIFKENKDVLDFYKNRFKYILVDEYQDTNAVQYLLIKLLAGEKKNICVVGDDDQSIYSWRGADINNILDFEKDFDGAKIIKLEQNYRSSQVILDAANNVIKNNLGRKSKNLWTEEKNGEKIGFYKAIDYKLEARYLAEKILVNKDRFGLKNCAVLYRNNFLSRIIEDEFVKRNIAYRLVGATRFYDRMEIKDLVGYLRFINNPDDEISLLRIINTPRRGIGSKSLEKIFDLARERKISVWKALKVCGCDSNKSLTKFVEMMDLLIEYKERVSIYDLMQKVIFEVKYKEYLEKQGEFVSRLENIEEFLAKIIEFENGVEKKNLLGDFLEQIALLSDIDNYNQEENAISLMTLHGAKGLEFDCVFIFGADDNIFPSDLKSDEELEEERRLFYVGITRAKKKLFITCAENRLINGKLLESRPSRFIKEIPGDLIEFERDKKKDVYIDLGSKKRFCLNELGNRNFYDYGEKERKNDLDLGFDYKVGDRVRNFKLGICVIKEILFLEERNDYKIVVELLDGSKKSLMASLVKFIKC